MTFEARFDDPAEAVHGWRRWSNEPMTRLYEDATRAYFEGMRRCWEATGSFLAADHLIHVANGWGYARAPSEGKKEADERFGRLAKHAASFQAKGTTYYDAEIKPEAVDIAKRLRRHPRPTKDLPTLVSHLKECIDAHAHV